MSRQKGIQSSRRKAIKTLASLAVIAAVPTALARTSGQQLPPDGFPPSGGGRPDRGPGIPAEGGDNPTANWLSGGTKNMTASFPEDAIFESGTTCDVTLTEPLKEGPCYFYSDYREDISDGLVGLPMQLCLQLTDQNCQPLPGYEIEVWHCDVQGIYSADTTNSPDSSRFATSFCSGDDEAALASRWFRGILVADSTGRVNFRSCFPGWYSGRAIHVHLRIRQNNMDALISQCGFNDFFGQKICTTHPDYAAHGEPDTYFNNDTVFSAPPDEGILFNLKANDDGSLLAYKRIKISV